ncbi:MAG: hypothetical protein LUG61_05845, partial [Lachnospiraceae bacterium]|nr:hypothetical protein [Lachnospiraceae bacterium]
DLNATNDYSQSVRYKLELDTGAYSIDYTGRRFTYKEGRHDVVFSDVIDVLPYTYGEFSWNDSNVEVYQHTYVLSIEDDEGNIITKPSNLYYEIYYSDEEGNEDGATKLEDGSYVLTEDMTTPAYQSIRWYELDDSGEKTIR